MFSNIVRSPVVLIIFSLALLGIGVQLFTNPGAFFTSIFITIGVVTVLILLFRTFIMPRLMNRQAGVPKQYKAAAKATQHKSQGGAQSFSSKKMSASAAKKKQNEKKKSVPKPLVRRPPDVKLTVIEGKKNKKKSRAHS